MLSRLRCRVRIIIRRCTSSLIRLFGATHVFPPKRRVAFISCQYDLFISFNLRVRDNHFYFQWRENLHMFPFLLVALDVTEYILHPCINWLVHNLRPLSYAKWTWQRLNPIFHPIRRCYRCSVQGLGWVEWSIIIFESPTVLVMCGYRHVAEDYSGFICI